MGRTDKTTTYLLAIGVAAVVAMVLFQMGYLGGSKAVVGPSGQPNSGGIATTTGLCPDTGKTDLFFDAYYMNFSSGEHVSVNTTARVYLKGSINQLLSDYTDATGATTSGAVNCLPPADEFKVIYGDGSTYYEAVYGLYTASGARMNVPASSAELKAVGSISITGSNGSSFGASTPLLITGMGSGDVKSDVSIKLKENTANAYFGSGGFLVGFTYTTGEFSSVTAVGGTSIACPTHITTAADANGTTRIAKCFEFTNELVNYGNFEVPVVISAKSGVTPGNKTNITISVIDKGTVLKNGEVLSAYEHPDTLADVGATDGTFVLSIRN